MAYSFFPMIARMRYINRWGLMRNTQTENIQEHSHMVAVLAHALAVIENEKFGGQVGVRGRWPWPPCTTTPARSSPATCPPPSNTTTPPSRAPIKQVEAVAAAEAAVHAAGGAAPRL